MTDTVLKIVFFGTPEFAVASLENLIKSGIPVSAVVTAPDKLAGRGQKLTFSPVKEFALQHNLRILQPTNLKDEHFLTELKEINPDLQIIVAFRMLPESVWNLPRLGTFNLHASLLPQYRGAAPINWAIINGEKITGVTTFFLKHEIDTGKIIHQEKLTIENEDTAGTLYEKLKIKGADLVVKTVNDISSGRIATIEQEKLIEGDLQDAPKLNRKNTKIDLKKSPMEIYNFVRGLNPIPVAHAELYSADGLMTLMVKVYAVIPEKNSHSKTPGTLETDNKSYLKVFVPGGDINITELQVSGRTKMNIKDFLNGFKLEGNWKMQ